MQAGPMVEQGLPAAAAYQASGLGSCDSRHKLLFEYPLFFGHRVSAKWRGRALGNRGEAGAP